MGDLEGGLGPMGDLEGSMGKGEDFRRPLLTLATTFWLYSWYIDSTVYPSLWEVAAMTHIRLLSTIPRSSKSSAMAMWYTSLW